MSYVGYNQAVTGLYSSIKPDKKQDIFTEEETFFLDSTSKPAFFLSLVSETGEATVTVEEGAFEGADPDEFFMINQMVVPDGGSGFIKEDTSGGILKITVSPNGSAKVKAITS